MVSPNDMDNDTGSQQYGDTPTKRRDSMTEDEQRDRRASIREIMQDETLTPLERRRSIQSLMDGRRRSSNGDGMSMAAAAAAAAAEFYDSSDDENMESQVIQNGDAASVSSISSNDRDASRQGSFSSFSRQGRSASLKAFASGALAAVAAAAAAAAEFSEDPEDLLNTAQRMEKSRPECTHYDRNCTIISPCCGLAFGCRICHDDCPVLPPPSDKPPTWQHNKKQKLADRRRRSLPTEFEEEESHHKIDRFAIKEVICRSCFTRQDCKT